MNNKTVYMEPDDWQISEYEAEIKCPYCGETDTYTSRELFHDGTEFQCWNCGKWFRLYCQP